LWGKNDPFFLPAGVEEFSSNIGTADGLLNLTEMFANTRSCLIRTGEGKQIVEISAFVR
jgi:hypothetical protein